MALIYKMNYPLNSIKNQRIMQLEIIIFLFPTAGTKRTALINNERIERLKAEPKER